MFESAKYLAVFKIQRPDQLSIRHSVVLSVLAYQDRYNSIPSMESLARSTGLSEGGAESCLEHLRSLNLISLSGWRVASNTDNLGKWFLPKQTFPAGLHWSLSLQYFPLFVRATDSPLRFSESVVFSFLKHLADKDTTRTSVAYLVTCLGFTEKTITGSLARLHEYFGLIGLAYHGKGFSFSIVENEKLAPLFRFAQNRGQVAGCAEPIVLKSQWLEEIQ